MSDGTRGPIEHRLAALADETDLEARRARSWLAVRRALREAPAPRRSPTWTVLWRPLALASAVGVAALALVLLQPPRAVVAAAQGGATAEVGGQVVALRPGVELPAGAVVRTPADGWVALRIGADRLSIDTASQVTLRELSRFPARVVIDQASGRTWHVPATDPQRRYAVRTEAGEVLARGTAFLVTTAAGRPTEVVTVEGTVTVEGAAGSVEVSAGKRTTLTAAPPVVEDAPTARLEATVIATVRDVLGRTCGADAQLPGCLPSGKGFVVAPEVATDLRVRVQVPAAGAVGLLAGRQRAEVTVPGQGIFEIRVDLKRSGREVRIEVKQEVEEVDELETPKPSGSRTPKPSETAGPSRSPKPSETPKGSETPKPSETAKASETPKPAETPEPSETPKPSETPEPPRTPERSRTPEPSRTPDPRETEKPETPKPSPTATR